MAIKLSNRGFSDVRLRIVPDAGTTLAIDHTTNPCVTMSSDNKELFACLGPFEISCVGAVSDSGPINLNGRFNIRLDGQIAASNMTAEELVEHFKDHPDIEVGLYEEEMIGVPYTGSYITDAMDPYQPSSYEEVTVGSSIWVLGESTHLNSVLDSWIAVQIIEANQTRHHIATPKLADLTDRTDEYAEYGRIEFGGAVARVLYNNWGFHVQLEKTSGSDPEPFAIAIFSPLSSMESNFGMTTTVSNLADLEITNVLIGSIKIIDGA